jgi:3-hydroxyacyl-[acyl-carrier-protein] dehydratase
MSTTVQAPAHVLPALLSVAELRRLLPHRYPMLLVDRVVDVEPGRRLGAVKAVTVNEPCFAGLPDDAVFDYPPTLLVESWGQAAGILAMLSHPDPDSLAGQVMLAGAMTGIAFHGPVTPGTLVRHEVRVERVFSDTVIFAGESTVDGDVVMTLARMVMAFRPAGALDSSKDGNP